MAAIWHSIRLRPARTGALKKKTRPHSGREFSSRGSTRFHPGRLWRFAATTGHLVGPITGPAGPPTCRRCPTFGFTLAGGFQRFLPGRASQYSARSPCQACDRLLVPVKAFAFRPLYASTQRCQAPYAGRHHWRKKDAPCGASCPVGETGLEPATSAMSKQCSNQLSYPPGRHSL